MIAAIATTALAGTAIIWVSQVGDRRLYTDDGPIDGYGDGSATVGAPGEVGDLHTNAMISLESTIDRPIVLERLRVEPPPDEGHIDIVGVLLAVDEDRGSGGADYGFPPTDRGRLVPLEGATLAPGADANLVVGVRQTEPGIGYWKRMFVDFRVGGEKYTVRYEHAFVMCAPAAAFDPKGCDENPYDDDFNPNAVR